MEIDVLINSCARPDMLETSVLTFQKRITSDIYKFNYVLLEDFVGNENRRLIGRKWIDEHSYLFDEIVFCEKKMGMDLFFAPLIKLGNSEIFFHLEDDNEFIVDLNIDDIVKLMLDSEDIVEIILNRDIRNRSYIGAELEINNVRLLEFFPFSVATGFFKKELMVKLLDKAGWNSVLHESKLLTPLSNIFGFKKFILGHGEQHYIHIGEKLGFRKGSWKNG